MSDEDLRDLLAQLHARLERAKSLDGESRKLLTTVARDIEATLARSSAATKTPDRLEALAVRLETDHPAIAEVLREIVDTLGRAGV
jgi:predicted component of type VI protein secretion system